MSLFLPLDFLEQNGTRLETTSVEQARSAQTPDQLLVGIYTKAFPLPSLPAEQQRVAVIVPKQDEPGWAALARHQGPAYMDVTYYLIPSAICQGHLAYD